MENFNIDEFNPTKAEIIKLVDGCKDLKIIDANDDTGYAMVKSAKKDLADKRILITKTGKKLRSQALKFQKDVITKEKTLIKLITPTEDALEEKILLIDNQKLLPERVEKLEEIEIKVGDEEKEELLRMSNVEFKNFFNEKNTEYLEKKAEKLRKIEEEQKKKEEILEAKRSARNAEKKRAEEKLNEKDEEIKRMKKEKEDEEKRVLDKKIDDKKAYDDEIEKADKNQRYAGWKKAHGYNEDTDRIKRIGDNEFVLWRKISSITIE